MEGQSSTLNDIREKKKYTQSPTQCLKWIIRIYVTFQKYVYNTCLYWKWVIRNSIKVFSKPSGLLYCQGYIHYSNRRHTKNNTWSWKSADTAKTSSNFEKIKNKKLKILIPDIFRKIHQNLWDLYELLKSDKAKYARGAFPHLIRVKIPSDDFSKH